MRRITANRTFAAHRLLAGAAMGALLACSGVASAQDAPAEPPTGDAPPAEAPPAPVPGGRQVYTPADFERYAPRNALDMLTQVPGFSIRENEQLRGLGQATGNVLFNGERPSNKSDFIQTQLQRIPADTVTRIEIVDGASLDIPGLSGQVANVVFEASQITGQFSWKPEFRPHFTDPLFTRGDVSISGRSGTLEYEVGLNNDDSGRSGAGGETLIYDGAGEVIETRYDVFTGRYDSPKLSGKLTWDAPGSSVAHLNAHYQRIYDRYREDGDRTSPGMPDELYTVRQNADSWNYEIGGDYEFALGPGRLKAIGLRRFSREPFSQEVVSQFSDGTVVGDRFVQTGDLGETIARGEYNWKLFGGDWQLSGEAAFNTLDNVAGLFTLDPGGEFVEVPFPGGTGGVSEDRYEGLLSFGRKLTNTFSFQIVAGAENSTITQSGADGLSRTFFRPKGSLSLSWNPSSTFDASLKIRRRVLQLSFYDFLARAFLDDENQNASNYDLRPQQDWSYEAEINKKLGAWGSQKFELIYRDVEDRVDIVPVEGGGEAVGNIPKSWAAAVVSTSTINFDPAGLKGLKLDATFVLQTSRLRDPFTGEKRQWSGFVNRQVQLGLRHDIPASNWAWGTNANHDHILPNYRSDSVDKVWEGPWWVSAFVEHKDVFGLTLRATAGNVFNARSRRERLVYDGIRGDSPLDFLESRDRLIGPIFSFSVRGNF